MPVFLNKSILRSCPACARVTNYCHENRTKLDSSKNVDVNNVHS